MEENSMNMKSNKVIIFTDITYSFNGFSYLLHPIVRIG